MTRLFIVLFFSFLSTLGIVYTYIKFTDAKNIKFKAYLLFILGVLFLAFVEYYKIPYLNFTAFFVFFPLEFYEIKPYSLKKIFYYVLIIWLYGMFVDAFSMVIFSLLHVIFDFSLASYWFIASHILTIIVFLTLIIISNSKKVKNFTNNLYGRLLKIKYADLSLISFSIFTFICGFLFLTNISNASVELFLTIFIILIITVFIILIKFKINEDENAKYLKLLKANNEFYVKMDDENRILKHNLIAKLLSIKSVSNKKARLLIEDIIKQYNKNIDFSKNINIVPYGFNGIIYEKLYNYLPKLNISIENNISYDIFKALRPRRYNVLVEKMIIMIDNAVESALDSKDKVIVVSLYEDGEDIVISIKNSIGNDIVLDDIGRKNYSTKGGKRGLGLFSALRNNEVATSFKIVNNLFVGEIKAKKQIAE